mgnify:CR=1 FL=1
MKRVSLLVAAAFSLVAGGCGKKEEPPAGSTLGPDEIPLRIAQVCPGDANCPAGGDGKLQVGVGVRDISPTIEPFTDSNGNRVWDFGEPYTDLNGNGQYDAYWMANDTGRQILGVHDPIWVRCYALRQDQSTVAHCAVDAIGYFHTELDQIRADLDPALGVDLVMTSATHDHSAPDTLGIFGPDDTSSGYKPDWMRWVRAQAVSAISEAVRTMRPAKMSIGAIATEEGPNHDMTHTIDDSRDPVVIDNMLHVMQFDGADDGKPIVTVVNWTAHPDSQSHSNRYVSSEFPNYLRQDVERHTGSPVVYVSGSVGGQVGPGRVRAITEDGQELPCGERSYRFIQAWGKYIARFANMAFDKRTEVPAPKLAFRTTRVNFHVDNIFYHTAFALKILPRQLFGYDKSKPMLRDENGDNAPLIDSELVYLTLGPAAIQTMPGELLPELFIGGYDGSRRGTWEPFVHKGPIYDSCDPTRIKNEGDYPAPADVTKAPKPPYLFDLMDGEPQHRMIFALTMDMLGYIVPAYDFYLDPVFPYLHEPPGDQHYEETNSLGPRAEAEMVGTARQLVLSARAKK